MTEAVKFIILPEHKLIIEYFNGNITIQDIIDSKNKKNKLENFNPSFDHIIDLRNAEFDFSHEEIKKIAEFQNANREYIAKRKSAFITSKPEHVSMAMLFSISIKHLPIEFEIFTTVGAALNRLDIWELSVQEYESKVEDLKNLS